MCYSPIIIINLIIRSGQGDDISGTQQVGERCEIYTQNLKGSDYIGLRHTDERVILKCTLRAWDIEMRSWRNLLHAVSSDRLL